MKDASWLLVANGSTANLYRVEKKTKLVRIESFEHPESRLHNQDLVSDKPGRDFESVGNARHAYTPHISPKGQEVIDFARQLVAHLEEGRINESFDRLYLVASPNMLGIMRQHLTPPTLKLIQGEADKDLTQVPHDRLIEQLPFVF